MGNERVDGMDVMKVYAAARKAIEHVRQEKKPYMLEIVTYRYRGHSMGDPERYRKAEEVHRYQENDPIGIFRKALIKKKVVAATELNEIDDKVEQDVKKAVEFAEASPEPRLEDLFTDIYAD